jgi:hypothetical protein
MDAQETLRGLCEFSNRLKKIAVPSVTYSRCASGSAEEVRQSEGSGGGQATDHNCL